jgi:hypothetical protein
MDLTVAKTILEQLGGRRFMVMTGARHLTGTENSLMFSLPYRNGETPNKVVIELTPMDVYTVTFSNVRAGKVRVLDTLTDVYADMLRDVIRSHTGLALSLHVEGLTDGHE